MADTRTISGLRRSPLDGLETLLRDTQAGDRAVRLEERPFLAMVSLRVDPGSETAHRIETALGAGLPRRCGELTSAGAHSVLWLGPDEWLVVSQADASALVQALTAAADGGHVAVVDVSANRTVLELSGPRARAVLEKGCPADLHPRAFADGSAVTTTLARVPVLLWKAEETRFRVLPRASFAPYVVTWLLDAMQEFSPQALAAGSA